VINVQADEPEIDPGQIDLLIELLEEHPDADMATLVTPLADPAMIADPNVVKAVVDGAGRALYFSRAVIPFDRQAGGVGAGPYLRHLGIYGYRKDFLLRYAELPASRLEQVEKLEQLRALENGFTILTASVDHVAEGIDTPQQYEAFVQRYRKQMETKR
jgi:3-deoxy-manno-octulosonate cytidylyltransferase (CMP-KDO synthetase)